MNKNGTIVILSICLAALIVLFIIFYSGNQKKGKELLQYEKRVLSLDEQVARLEEEKQHLGEKLGGRADLEQELDAAKGRISEIENAVKAKDQTISEFGKKFMDYKERLAKETKANESLKEQLSSSQKRGKGLEEKLSSSLKRTKELEDQLASARSRIEEMEAEMSEAKTAVNRFQGRLEDLKGEKAQAENRVDQVKSNYEALISDLRKQMADQEVTIKTFKQEITLTFVDRVLFDFGKATISPKGRAVLEKVGDVLKNVHDRRIRIIGHTDNIPIQLQYREKFPSNWELSAARAAAIVRYFIRKNAMNPTVLEAVGRSYYAPIASNETEQGRAQNRRVEILIAPVLEN